MSSAVDSLRALLRLMIVFARRSGREGTAGAADGTIQQVQQAWTAETAAQIAAKAETKTEAEALQAATAEVKRTGALHTAVEAVVSAGQVVSPERHLPVG